LGGLLCLGAIEFIKIPGGGFQQQHPAAVKKVVSAEPVIGKETKPGNIPAGLLYFGIIVLENHHRALIVPETSENFDDIFGFAGFNRKIFNYF
jgi:hypothetical protein